MTAMMTSTRRRRGAFTLIEMLVVIAIIAILAAIRLPMIHAAQRRANMASCQANLHQLALGVKTYYSDYKAYPAGSLTPGSGLKDDNGNSPGASSYDTFTSSGQKSRIGALYPNYVQEQKTFICPEESDAPTSVLSTATLNGQPLASALTLTGDPNYTSSPYDDYYNYYGYNSDGSLVTAPPASPQRLDKMLYNRYCPDNALLTYCRLHEEAGDAGGGMDILVRIAGSGSRVPHNSYDFSKQPETTSN